MGNRDGYEPAEAPGTDAEKSDNNNSDTDYLVSGQTEELHISANYCDVEEAFAGISSIVECLHPRLSTVSHRGKTSLEAASNGYGVSHSPAPDDVVDNLGPATGKKSETGPPNKTLPLCDKHRAKTVDNQKTAVERHCQRGCERSR